MQKTFCERYKSIFEEGNNKKQQYGCEQYQNLSDYEKQNLVEYRNRYYESSYLIVEKLVIQRKYKKFAGPNYRSF